MSTAAAAAPAVPPSGAVPAGPPPERATPLPTRYARHLSAEGIRIAEGAAALQPRIRELAAQAREPRAARTCGRGYARHTGHRGYISRGLVTMPIMSAIRFSTI